MITRTASLVGRRIVKPRGVVGWVFLFLTASSVSGQQPGDTVRVSGAATFKDWPVAFTLELFVPTLGHAYAGDFDRGIAPALVTGVGVGVVALAYSRTGNLGDNWTYIGLVGIGAVAGGKTWGVVSAVRATLDHNRALRERVTPALALTPDGRALIGVSVRF